MPASQALTRVSGQFAGAARAGFASKTQKGPVEFFDRAFCFPLLTQPSNVRYFERFALQTPRLRQRRFVAIRSVAATIDDQKIAHALQREQRMMPDASRVIDALPAARRERS